VETARVTSLNNARSGCRPEPDHALGATHPTVNSELFYPLRLGHITPRPDIVRFDGHAVVRGALSAAGVHLAGGRAADKGIGEASVRGLGAPA